MYEDLTLSRFKRRYLITLKQFDAIQTYNTLFYCSEGQKIIDFTTQCNALQRIQSKATQFYIP